MNRREFMESLPFSQAVQRPQRHFCPSRNNYAHADILPEGDPRIVSETLTYAGGADILRSLVPRQYPGVLVIHENRGLNPHIRTWRAAWRLKVRSPGARLFNDLGGTPEDADKARDMIGTLKPEGINARPQQRCSREGQPCVQWKIRRHRLLLGRRHGE